MADWDRRFMQLALHIAEWSKEDVKVGAVVVGPDREIRSTGYNGFPRGVKDDVPARMDRKSGEKFFWTSHAERNAIYNAARVGVPMHGCKLYASWFPCTDCTKAIIQSGIAELISFAPDFNDAKWGQEFARSQTMLTEAGVTVRFVETAEGFAPPRTPT